MHHRQRIQAVVLGASWGGIEASIKVLERLPANLPVPVFLAQHLRVSTENRLPKVLGQKVEIDVVSPEDKTDICPSRVFVAPPGYHMLVEDKSQVGLAMYWPVHYSRPSIDELFFSAGHVYGDGTLAVLLTGANEDGAAGIEYIARRGGVTVVQNPQTAEAPVMPQSAIDTGCVQHVLDVERIGDFSVEHVFGLTQ